MQRLLERVEDLAAGAQRVGERVEKPTGTIMNSWKSTLLSACAPPFRTFIIGTGSRSASSPPRWRQSGSSRSIAIALAAASETPRIALAPSRALFGVPSSSIIVRSSAAWSAASSPCTASVDLAVGRSATALRHALAAERLAAVAQLDRLELAGGGARRAPPRGRRRRSSSPTSTSTVGLPRLSITWRAWTCWISLTRFPFLNLSADARRASSGSTRARGPARRRRTTACRVPRTGSSAGPRGRSPRARRAALEQLARRRGARSRPDAARRSSLRAYSVEGRFSGTSWKTSSPPRPGSVRLIWSQLRSTVAASSASASPNTCGWRRISFWRQCSATAARSPWPRSSSRSDRK